MNECMKVFFNNNIVVLQHIMARIIQYSFMIGESLLLLKGHSRSHVTCKVLCPFQTKTQCYKIEYKVTVTVTL